MSKLSTIARLSAALGVVVTLAACSDAPSAPATPSAKLSPVVLSRSKGGAGITGTVGRTTPLAQAITATFAIDPRRKGRVELRDAGLEIDIPEGAVSSPVTISVTALAGNVVAYEFQPHGLVFRRPLRVRQDLRAIDLGTFLGGFDLSKVDAKKLRDLDLEIAYFASVGDLDVAQGTARVSEFLASNFDFSGHRVEFDIEHFSGYMVSWGRGGRDRD